MIIGLSNPVFVSRIPAPALPYAPSISAIYGQNGDSIGYSGVNWTDGGGSGYTLELERKDTLDAVEGAWTYIDALGIGGGHYDDLAPFYFFVDNGGAYSSVDSVWRIKVIGDGITYNATPFYSYDSNHITYPT